MDSLQAETPNSVDLVYGGSGAPIPSKPRPRATAQRPSIQARRQWSVRAAGKSKRAKKARIEEHAEDAFDEEHGSAEISRRHRLPLCQPIAPVERENRVWRRSCCSAIIGNDPEPAAAIYR